MRMLWWRVVAIVRSVCGVVRPGPKHRVMAERMRQIEERLGELERLVGDNRDDRSEGARLGAGAVEMAADCAGRPVVEAAADEEAGEAVCTEVLRKAGNGETGGVRDEAVEEDVRPGRPQSLRGQQARHGAARLWEGVL